MFKFIIGSGYDAPLHPPCHLSREQYNTKCSVIVARLRAWPCHHVVEIARSHACEYLVRVATIGRALSGPFWYAQPLKGRDCVWPIDGGSEQNGWFTIQRTNQVRDLVLQAIRKCAAIPNDE